MQAVLVIVIIAAALGFLGRQVYQRFFTKETKCDDCAVNKLSQDS